MMRRFFYWLLRLVLLAALVLVIWAGWYVYRKGFTKKWRQFVSAEFRKRGVEISFSRLTLDPVHGLVARDVVIVDTKDHKKLAVINRIALDINFNNFLRGKPFLKGLDLRDARLSLPLDPSDPVEPDDCAVAFERASAASAVESDFPEPGGGADVRIPCHRFRTAHQSRRLSSGGTGRWRWYGRFGETREAGPVADRSDHTIERPAV